MKYPLLLIILTVLSANAFGQNDSRQTAVAKAPSVASASTGVLDVAKATLAAHGGEKLRSMKTLIVRGSAEISGSPTAVFPATFEMVFAGDKYKLEISNPFQPLKQVYDGTQTVSSIPNFSLPPINRLGLPMLQRIEEKNYKVEALPEKSRKKAGFRVTAPDGYYTDFFVDEKTGLIKSYESTFDVNGRLVSTSVEVDKFRDVEGIKIPEKYAQRFELGTITMYSSFKARDIVVNSDVPDTAFTM